VSPLARETGRTCLGCRRQRPRAELVRIVRGPDGAAVFDLEARLPGRGAWVCPAAACLDRLAAGALAHVLRAPVLLPEPAARRATLGAALERRVGNLLGMARRVRALVVGQTGVRAALRDGRAALLLLASDLPPDTLASWREQAGGVPVRAACGSDALGALAGREAFGCAALCSPGLAGAIAAALDQREAISHGSCDNVPSMKRAGRVERRGCAPGRGEATER
jgi:predicted RNA-binding protein YlxR (DUF448 family)/ribosomal protein L7Ae-like RNA K-turn-binding protein